MLPFTTGSAPSEGLDGDWQIELEGENTAMPAPPLGRGCDLLQASEAERTPNLPQDFSQRKSWSHKLVGGEVLLLLACTLFHHFNERLV